MSKPKRLAKVIKWKPERGNREGGKEKGSENGWEGRRNGGREKRREEAGRKKTILGQ